MAAPPAQRRVVGYEGGRKKVLVADDIVGNRSLLVDLLEPLGFEVSEAQDGREALEKAEQLRPDLILMDMVMPKMGGLEATRRLRETPAFRQVPIIAISAGAGSTDQAQSVAGGANAFLSKPIDVDQLVEQIGALLRLTWRHEEAVEAPAAANDATGPLQPPPQEELEVLHRLARMGNMRELRERAVHIAALDPRYRLFADKLYRLADAFQSQAILGFVKKYIERG
jgi:CheY-like chemotaxis protein